MNRNAFFNSGLAAGAALSIAWGAGAAHDTVRHHNDAVRSDTAAQILAKQAATEPLTEEQKLDKESNARTESENAEASYDQRNTNIQYLFEGLGGTAIFGVILPLLSRPPRKNNSRLG